jgi:hypothetical protein
MTTIVDFVEEHVGRKPGASPSGLTEPTRTWIDRMWHAVIDPDLSEQGLVEIGEPFGAYLGGLAEDEYDEAEAMWDVLKGLVAHVRICEGCGRPLCPCCNHTETGDAGGEEEL